MNVQKEEELKAMKAELARLNTRQQSVLSAQHLRSQRPSGADGNSMTIVCAAEPAAAAQLLAMQEQNERREQQLREMKNELAQLLRPADDNGVVACDMSHLSIDHLA